MNIISSSFSIYIALFSAVVVVFSLTVTVLFLADNDRSQAEEPVAIESSEVQMISEVSTE